MSVTRRQMVRTAALGAIGLGASGGVGLSALGLFTGAVSPARAFSFETAPAATTDEYRAACSARSQSHAEILRKAMSEAGLDLSDADRDAILRLARCPYCGCSLNEISANELQNQIGS